MEYFKSFFNYKKTIYIKSDLDDQAYLVKNTYNSKKAANLLSYLKNNILILICFLKNNLDKYQDKQEYISILIEKIPKTVLSENDEAYYKSSYVVSKGKEIVLCLRNENDEFYDVNLLTFIMINLISLIANPEIGHTNKFYDIFHFLIKIAIEIGIYHEIDFSKYPIKNNDIII